MMQTKFALLLFTVILSSCKLVDLRTPTVLTSNDNLEQKGRELLASSVKAMGYDQLTEISTYESTVHFKWRFPWSIMPMSAFPGTGKNGKTAHEFDFVPNTFDGTITYGKSGKVYGLQSWQSYQKIGDRPIQFTKDKKRSWGLGTWHYLLESPYRLLAKAPIIKYAGQEKIGDINYDKVFITWGKEEANKQFDHWLVYINPTTKFIDLSHVTVRDFFMPMPNNMAQGVIRYGQRQKTSAGIWFPELMNLEIGGPKEGKKYVYQVRLSSFRFDSFQKEDLYPNTNLEGMMDVKPMANKK